MSKPSNEPSGAPGEDYFQHLADGAPVMIWMAGLDMGCFYFNRAWLDFRGRTLAQEWGNGWAEGVHPEDLERCVNHYVACFQRRMAFAMSYRLQNAKGEFRWILDRGVPHFLPDGTFLGFFGGCAELADEDAVNRHVELGSGTAALRVFAQRVASGEGPRSNAPVPLEVSLRQLLASHEKDRQRIQFASEELKRLAEDMATLHAIDKGACLAADDAPRA